MLFTIFYFSSSNDCFLWHHWALWLSNHHGWLLLIELLPRTCLVGLAHLLNNRWLSLLWKLLLRNFLLLIGFRDLWLALLKLLHLFHYWFSHLLHLCLSCTLPLLSLLVLDSFPLLVLLNKRLKLRLNHLTRLDLYLTLNQVLSVLRILLCIQFLPLQWFPGIQTYFHGILFFVHLLFLSSTFCHDGAIGFLKLGRWTRRSLWSSRVCHRLL